jgi:hypothetical protein
MFGKRQCSRSPVFRDVLTAKSAALANEAVKTLVCRSGSTMIPETAGVPGTAEMIRARKNDESVWLYSQSLRCSLCGKTGSVSIATPGEQPPPNPQAIRSHTRPDVHALECVFLPEWFLNVPDTAVSMLSTSLEAWQTRIMKQIGSITGTSPEMPFPIRNVQIVATPSQMPAVLVDFIPPRAAFEAYHAFLVAGPSPRMLMSERWISHEDGPVTEMAGLVEWSLDYRRDNLERTVIGQLVDTDRNTFYLAAISQPGPGAD